MIGRKMGLAPTLVRTYMGGIREDGGDFFRETKKEILESISFCAPGWA